MSCFVNFDEKFIANSNLFATVTRMPREFCIGYLGKQIYLKVGGVTPFSKSLKQSYVIVPYAKSKKNSSLVIEILTFCQF